MRTIGKRKTFVNKKPFVKQSTSYVVVPARETQVLPLHRLHRNTRLTTFRASEQCELDIHPA